MSQNMQGLRYEACSANIAKIFPLELFILGFGVCAIIHQLLVAMLRGLIRFVYILVGAEKYSNSKIISVSNIQSCREPCIIQKL